MQRQLLDIAVRNSKRLHPLINDLLDMERITSDRSSWISVPATSGNGGTVCGGTDSVCGSSFRCV